MLRKFVIAALVASILTGLNQIAYAESGSPSVKECLENKAKCSKGESTKSKEKRNFKRRPPFPLGIL